MKRFRRVRIGVIGDMVADIYVFGRPARLSREAPVVITEYESETFIPGSGANAVNNIASLGARVYAVGLLGDDRAGAALREKLEDADVDTGGLFTLPGRITPTKTRFLVGDRHTQKQQVLRLDREVEGELSSEAQHKLVDYIDHVSAGLDAWLVSDYGYDLMTAPLIRKVRHLARSTPVIVDSRYRLGSFKGVTVITPNEGEAEAASGMGIRGQEDAKAAGRRLLSRLGCQAVLLTRGNEGMMLFQQEGRLTRIPIHGETEIVDVTGAGDTVASVFTLALGAGASMVQAARLANYGAGVVVMKSGAATLSREELLEAIGSRGG